MNRIQQSPFIFLWMLFIAHAAFSQNEKLEWTVTERKDKKQIDILWGDKLLTSYCYYDSTRKPILFPVRTVSGITVTRGFPIKPLPGETADHPHHMGLWLNYEYVNGFDFWNNSTAVPLKERAKYGTIHHDKVISSKATSKEAELVVRENWIIPDGTTLLKEQTQFIFHKDEAQFIIDRITTLTAQAKEVSFKDTKDGFIAIRVARELEMPIKGRRELVDHNGNVTKGEDDGEIATGLYLNSEGLTGDAAWGARARWCTLAGKKEGQDISISIIDHPKNIGYPTYWHARGYGLFAANPLGQEIFSQGKLKLNFLLPANQSVTFRFRIVIISGKKSTAQETNLLADEFAKAF